MKSLRIALLLLLAYTPVHSEEKILHLYNWANYMLDEVLQQFRQETGIRVVSDYFASNEELLAKLQAGAFEYDVVLPSDYYVKLFIAQDLAEPLQHELLPNRHHLEERFQNPPYDPNNRYSIPYFWGTTGIGYNRKKVGEAITSWAALSDPRWKRKINLFDDMREVLGIPFHLMNEPLNTRDPQVLEKARKALLAQKEIVRTYNSSTYKEILNAGDVWLTQGFSGDVLQLRKENPDIEFVNPKEGGTIFVDNMMIPKSSRKKVDAHTFINFILRPEIGAKLSGTLGFATPSKTAHELLPEEVRNDPAVYPPQEVMEKLEYISDVGPALSQYEDIWMDLKTH